MSSYREELTEAMTILSGDPMVRFVGYGLRHGRAGGTLKNVADSQIVETTTTENLLVGMAIGMSLKGLKPVVYVERADFIWNAADAIVNHLDSIKTISHGEFNPCIILRVVVGNKTKPLFTGHTHTRYNIEALKRMVSFPVLALNRMEEIGPSYAAAYRALSVPDQNFRSSTMLYEFKDKL